MNRNDFNGAWFENWIPKLGRSKSHAWCAGPTALLPRRCLELNQFYRVGKNLKLNLIYMI